LRRGLEWLLARLRGAADVGAAAVGPGGNGFFELGGFGKLAFALDSFSFSGAVEGGDLAGGQFAKAAGLDVELEGSVGDAADFFNVVTDLLEHLAELPVATLGEGDLEPRVIAAANLHDLRGGGDDAIAAAGTDLVQAAAIDHDAAAELVDGFRRGDARDFDEVGFEDTGGGFREGVGEVAVVGHQEQALGEVIEAADGVEARKFEVGTRLLLTEEIGDGGTFLGIDEGGDEAARLVEHEVALRFGPLEELAVDADVVLVRIGFGAELGDGLTVDLDAALQDDLFGLSAGGDAGLGEDLLEAIAALGTVLRGGSFGGNSHASIMTRAGSKTRGQRGISDAGPRG